MTDLARALAEIPSRPEIIHRHKQAGGLVAAVYPIHYPRALLRAFGILPVEVWGPAGVNTELGDAHLQAYTCAIIRNGLSLLLSGTFDEADLVLVPHGCDSLQGLGSILLDLVKPRQPVLTLYLPRGDGGDTEKAVAFYADEFRSAHARIAETTGRRADDGALCAAVEAEERAAGLAAELLRERRRIPLGDRDFYRVLRSREFLPAEEFEGLAARVLASRTDGAVPGTPVILSGIVPEPPEVLDAIAGAGGFVAGDDLACTGRRVYPAGKDSDPFRRMAESILNGAPDPMRGSAIGRRIAHLRGLCEAAGARGVLFYDVKFCEPELFYLPQVRKQLGEEGIRSVVLETDLGEHLPHQTITRIEAFLETLS